MGNYYTPKFSLLFFKSIHIFILKSSSRVDQMNPLLSNQPTTRVLILSSQIWFLLSQVITIPHHMSQGITMSSFKPHSSSLLSHMVENQLYWTKTQLWSTYCQTSSFLVNIRILKSLSSFDQGLIMNHQENSRFDQKSKFLN